LDQSAGRILVVDDEVMVLEYLERALTRVGHNVQTAESGEQALERIERSLPDVVLCDIRMPGIDGMEVLRRLKQTRPDVQVVMMTAFGTIRSALDAAQQGAFDYLQKPFENMDDVLLTVRNALERRNLLRRNQELERAVSESRAFDRLVGESPAMREVLELVGTVAPSSSTVLLVGETGTGKELVARAIHQASPRRDRPMIAVHCAALTESLLESELFGHVKGAFTGAARDRAGLFEAADHGSVFLDEISEVSPATQVKLLRVLQEGEVRRVGATSDINVDLRVIAATNVELQERIREGRFREDLYYRLNVIRVDLPPLRERSGDIPMLAHHFARKYAGKTERPAPSITPETVALLERYAWPGNVRELENAIERAVVLRKGDAMQPRDLPPEIRGAGEAPAGTGGAAAAEAGVPLSEAKGQNTRDFEQEYVQAVVRLAEGNLSEAARRAGLDRSNFRKIAKRYLD